VDSRLPPESTLVGGRYRVVRAIGSGGMGAVFEAEDTVLGRRVALKILRRAELDDEAQLARFEREARAVARLNDPNVVGVSDFVRDPEWGPAMVLELLVGESLMARLARAPRPSEAELVDVAVQALGALEHAHAAGMVHRDLKPSNLFLVTLGSGLVVTKVLDFGIVKLIEDGQSPKLTAPGAAIGTPAYMPVEQALGGVVDARSDVYAMGALLYEALAGRLPYPDGDPMQVIGEILSGPPPDLADVAPDVSPDLAAIVMRAMARDATGRYASAAAMRAALRSVRLMPAGWRQRVAPPTRDAATIASGPRARHGPLPSTPDTSDTPLPPRSTSPALVVGVALGLLGAMLAVGALAWRARTADAVERLTPAPPPSTEREAIPVRSVPPPSAEPPHGAEPLADPPRGIDPPPVVPSATPRLTTGERPRVPRPTVTPTPASTSSAPHPPGPLGDAPLDPFGTP
jgi:serine/threonine-protein kinase